MRLRKDSELNYPLEGEWVDIPEVDITPKLADGASC